MANRINYKKLGFEEAQAERMLIEDDPASRNRIGKYRFNARAAQKLRRLNALILYWPRKEAAPRG